jgi:ABC-type glycerol-3-phosphate transport system substrate-binding protein
MSTFKIILLSIFGIGAVLGVIIFASYKGSGSSSTGPVVMWGFIPQSSFNIFAKEIGLDTSKQFTFTYVEKNPASFEADFEKALADGNGPDIIMLREDMLQAQKNRLFVIPYANYPERDFKTNFIQSTELFLGSMGTYALPLYVDPLVMYWNRTLFTNAALSVPPHYWDEFLTLPQKLTKKSISGNITQSLIALGEWKNITNAKEIISNLLIQGGNDIVYQPRTGAGQSLLIGSIESGIPSDGAVNFYTQFANPVTAQYSWNRSLPNSTQYFLLGNLATYIGFASELPEIRAKNPNLNFDVTLVPQPRQSERNIVYAHIYGLAISKQSKNVPGAFLAINTLTSESSEKTLESYTNLPSPRRKLLGITPSDPYKTVFYQSAIQSVTWPDPNRKATSNMFQNMIESITAGRMRVSEAIQKADSELQALFSNKTE